MQDKKNLLDEHKKILNSIKEHNKNYFIYDDPKITDSAYDKIKAKAIRLEKKFPFLKKIESIQNIIGAKPLNKFKKIRHLSPMLSLANAFNLNDATIFRISCISK